MNMENLIAVSNKLVEVNNKLTEVTAQRDTLAEALREFIEEQCEHRPHDHSDALGNARKALAAVKGGSNE